MTDFLGSEKMNKRRNANLHHGDEEVVINITEGFLLFYLKPQTQACFLQKKRRGKENEQRGQEKVNSSVSYDE